MTIIIDRYVGRMEYIRSFSGTLKKDDRLVNARTGLKIASLTSSPAAKNSSPTNWLPAYTASLPKLEDVLTGDTLTAFPESRPDLARAGIPSLSRFTLWRSTHARRATAPR